MNETLGRLIQRRMKELNIPSKAELARRLGISGAYAGDLANDTGKTRDGHYQPSKELTDKLTSVLQISSTEIMTSLGYKTALSAEDAELIELEAMYRRRKELTGPRLVLIKELFNMIDRELDRLYAEEMKLRQEAEAPAGVRGNQ